jgi:hypothetical protein
MTTLRCLQEMFELWYWALFRPARLQERMNAWSPRVDREKHSRNTTFMDILLFYPSGRFIGEFVTLLVLLSMPVFWILQLYAPVSAGNQDLYIWLGTLAAAYALGIWFLPAGLSLPVLAGLLVIWEKQLLNASTDDLVRLFAEFRPNSPTVLKFWGIAGLVLLLMLGVAATHYLLRREKRVLAGILLMLCGTAGSWGVARICFDIGPMGQTIGSLTFALLAFCCVVVKNSHRFYFVVWMVSGMFIAMIGGFVLKSMDSFDNPINLLTQNTEPSPVSITAREAALRKQFVLEEVDYQIRILLRLLEDQRKAKSLESRDSSSEIRYRLDRIRRYINEIEYVYRRGPDDIPQSTFSKRLIAFMQRSAPGLLVVAFVSGLIYGLIGGILAGADRAAGNRILAFLAGQVLVSFAALLWQAMTAIEPMSLRFLNYEGLILLLLAVGLATALTISIGAFFEAASASVSGRPVARLLKSIVLIGAAFLCVIPFMICLAATHALPGLKFLIVSWLVGFSFAPHRSRWLGVIIAAALTMFYTPNSMWMLVGPAVLIGYYRLLPDYALLAPLSFCLAILPSSNPGKQLPRRLRALPSYTDELIWLPLPLHRLLLLKTFHFNITEAIKSFNQLIASPLPGCYRVARSIVPEIVSEQMAAIQTLDDLIKTESPDHPYLPLLAPAFYQPRSLSGSDLPSETPLVAIFDPEVALMVPRLHIFARDTAALVQAGSPGLVARGLERVVHRIKQLEGQLPALGLTGNRATRWQRVLTRWQTVLQASVDQLHSETSGEIVNPYQFGNPIRPDRADLFKGRKKLADRILRLLLDRNRPTLVLYGQRRCGKSSFLLNLSRLLPPSEVISVYIDLQMPGVTESEGDFLYSIVWAIRNAVRAEKLSLPEAKRENFQERPYVAFEDWLNAAFPLLGPRRVLLNLDEFEKLGSAVDAGRLSERLLDELRSMIQHREAIGLLFSGVRTLAELGPNWNSYFISVIPIEMSYLERQEARELLVKPDPQFDLTYEEAVVEEILHLTHCHPYLIQLLGWVLVQQANEQEKREVSSDMLPQAIEEAFEAGAPYFTNIWDEFTGRKRDEIKAGRAFLCDLAWDRPISVQTPMETGALQRLTRYHIITKVDSKYRIEIPLFQKWVKERSELVA